MELEILRAYIEKNLANGFIKSFKFSTRVPFFFDKKSDGSLRLCINDQDLNNLFIKNKYLLLLIQKSLNWLGRAQHFNQLDQTNTYHQIRIRESNK